MHIFWTKSLEQKEIDKGNIYMVRERARWSFFQMAIVGLQGLPRVQILVVSLIQTVYFMVICIESKKNRIFKSILMKLKILFQELAIVVFLIVLCIFSFAQNSDFKTTRSFDRLEYVVIVAIMIAIGCEALAMVYTLYDAVAQQVKKIKNNKKVDDEDDENENQKIGDEEPTVDSRPNLQKMKIGIKTDQFKNKTRSSSRTNLNQDYSNQELAK